MSKKIKLIVFMAQTISCIDKDVGRMQGNENYQQKEWEMECDVK